MQSDLFPVRIKLTFDGEEPQPLLEVADAIRSLYVSRAAQSGTYSW